MEVTQPGCEAKLAVQKALLHVFDGDIALLTLQLSATEPVKWETALNIISYLRTVYFQGYRPTVNESASGPGIVWKGAGGIEYVRILPLQTSPPDAPVDRAGEMRRAIESLRPAIHPHWRALLEPLTRTGIEVSTLGDHRMAAMVFLGIEDVASISDDQWFALVQADDATFPRYAEAFRRRELDGCVYDRWWDPGATDPNALKHRYLAGPLTYCCVLRVARESRPPYIDVIRTAWRHRHYQLFLLAHYQRAALLTFQDRIARAAEHEQRQAGRVDLQAEIQAIQREMTLFSSSQWFKEVSPQIQGQELYTLLAKQLRLQALYDGVIKDKALLGNWAAAREARHRERWRVAIDRFVIPAVFTATVFNGNVLVDPLRSWYALPRLLCPWTVDWSRQRSCSLACPSRGEEFCFSAAEVERTNPRGLL